MDDALEKLLQKTPQIWRGRSAATGWEGLSSGYPPLDRHLPGGGWPPNALTEILLAHYGSGELKLLMPALARLSQAGQCPPPGPVGTHRHATEAEAAGWIAWIAPPFHPYPPALIQWGVDPSRVLIVRPKTNDETLWAAEQALSSGNCAAVLLWSEALDDVNSRRLQLSAETGRSWAIAFRPLSASLKASAAALRIRLTSSANGTTLDILKSRGGRPVTLRNVLQPSADTASDESFAHHAGD